MWLSKTKSDFVRIVITATLATLLGAEPAKAAETLEIRQQDNVLGTHFELSIWGGNPDAADRAEAAALGEIDRLSASLSSYDPTSELSQLNKETARTVSKPLLTVLSRCEELRLKSMNSLSCRVGGLLEQWRQAEKSQTLPSSPKVRLLAGRLKRAEVQINSETRAVSRPAEVIFNVNSLAKGYIIDQALIAARKAAPNVKGLLLNIGGDVGALGTGPHGGQWHAAAGASAKSDTVAFQNGAVATSGRSGRDYVINGEHFSHVISPQDGWSTDHVAFVTVYAPNAMTADAIATALMVMEIGDGLALAASEEGVEAQITAKDGHLFSTKGWRNLTLAEDGKRSASAWPQGFTFEVDLKIPEHDVADYRRPYVAAWISDTDRNLVRILLLAGDSSRWMEENYYWQRRVGRTAGSLIDAISEPTRKPGDYTLTWDGFDYEGTAVPAAPYILNIEAAREHGDHQLERVEIEFGDTPFSKTLPTGAELGTIHIRYGAE